MAKTMAKTMTRTIVTGFTPFDGRDVNASWIAANSLAGRPNVCSVEIPVIWAEPLKHLAPLCEATCPDVIISMGEGREGWFDVETIARNTRQERADNTGKSPGSRPIYEAGPAQLEASINAYGLRRALASHQYPVRISRDAGAFLCEETLYTLESLKRQHARLATVVFVHLPPFGTEFTLGGEIRSCDEHLLESFAATLFDAVHALHRAQGPNQ